MENNRGLRVTIPSNILRSTKNQIASLLYRLQISEANKEIKSSNYKGRRERERERERERVNLHWSKINTHKARGQNGQIPHFLEIFSKKTLFRK